MILTSQTHMRQSWESMEASGGRHNTRRPCGPGDWPLRTSVAWTGAGDNNKKKRRSSQCSSSPLFSVHKRSGRCCRGATVTPAESDARSAAAFSLFLRSERHPAGREHDLKPLSGFFLVFRVLAPLRPLLQLLLLPPIGRRLFLCV